jgi:hypothetical protein
MTVGTLATCMTETMTRARLFVDQHEIELTVLEHGSCERLKAGVHASTLGLAVVMGAYNAAAWLRRRERHLALNAVLYATLILIERHHVAHHLALCRRSSDDQ